MKIFISYSTKDRPTAAALYRDLRKGGAAAFQFGESETAGTPAWGQIIDWINECDAFVVLISKHAVSSTAVAEEIAMAHDCYINSERTKPAKIIPAIIEATAAPPILIRRMSFLDLVDYKAGLPKLLRELGLKVVTPAPKSAAPALPAIDFDKLAREHAKENPLSPKEKQVRADVRNLLTEYEQFKPSDLPKKAEEQHVDSLVAGVMGKSPNRLADPKEVAGANQAFLGLELPEKSALMRSLLDANRSELRIKPRAPTLQVDGDTLRWDAVPGATAYVVQRKADIKGFEDQEVYRGPELSYKVPSLLLAPTRFRVKATTVLGGDSSWSELVKVAATRFVPTGKPLAALQLAPYGPQLTVDRTSFLVRVSWLPVPGATSYVLQRGRGTSTKTMPDLWTTAYEGPETEFKDTPLLTLTKGELNWYRAKAVGPWGETQWRY